MRRYLPCAIIVLAGVLAWSSSLLNGFALDDLIHIRDNYQLHLSDYGWSVLTTPAFPGNLYRPVTFASYYIQASLGGLNPLPFHLFNLAIHLLLALLTFRLLKALLTLETALLAATLFVVHPLHTESIANVVGRAELLSAFFVLLSLWIAVHLRSGPALNFIALLVSAFLAAASKESGVVVPLLVALWCFVSFGTVRSRRALLAIGASVTGVATYLLLRATVMGGEIYSSTAIDAADNPLASLSGGRRVLEAAALLGRYLAKLISPYPLSADYSFAVINYEGPLSVETLFTAGVVALLLCSAALMCLRRKLAGALLLWFFFAFALTCNVFFSIGTVFAERLTYLPGIGVIALIALALKSIPHRIARSGVILILIISAIAYSATHSPVWRDTAALADYQEGVSPRSFRTQLLCAARDKNRRQFESALLHLHHAREILSRNDDAEYLEGAVRIEQGEYPLAEAAFRRALEINPRHTPTLALYGRLLLNLDRLDQAAQLATLLQSVRSRDPEAEVIFLALALKRGTLSEARAIADRLDLIDYRSDDFQRLKSYLVRETVAHPL